VFLNRVLIQNIHTHLRLPTKYKNVPGSPPPLKKRTTNLPTKLLVILFNPSGTYKMIYIKKIKNSLLPVAHTYNPSYLGGRDQEDRGLRPGQVNSLRNPISKIPNTRKS
jgi:hypothetical protein